MAPQSARSPADRSTVVAAALISLCVATFITFTAASSATSKRHLRLNLPYEPVNTVRPNIGIETIAHRGASLVAPENTLAAFQQAIDLGFDYVELDVRLTADGVPVVFHDSTLERTTGVEGNLHEWNYAKLRELDVGSWFSPEFADQRIPTLDETLQLLRGKVCVMWDTKAKPNARIVNTFLRNGFTRDCVLVTAGALGPGENTETIEILLALWPAAPVTPIARQPEDIARIIHDHPQTRAVRVFPGYVSNQLVDTAHAAGLRVVTSNLLQDDRPERYRQMMEAGVDFVMYDDQAAFAKTRASLSAEAAAD